MVEIRTEKDAKLSFLYRLVNALDAELDIARVYTEDIEGYLAKIKKAKEKLDDSLNSEYRKMILMELTSLKRGIGLIRLMMKQWDD